MKAEYFSELEHRHEVERVLRIFDAFVASVGIGLNRLLFFLFGPDFLSHIFFLLSHFCCILLSLVGDFVTTLPLSSSPELFFPALWAAAVPL